jgi:hypothetical protein
MGSGGWEAVIRSPPLVGRGVPQGEPSILFGQLCIPNVARTACADILDACRRFAPFVVGPAMNSVSPVPPANGGSSVAGGTEARVDVPPRRLAAPDANLIQYRGLFRARRGERS